MCRFGAWCCVPNPNCLAERAVASAGQEPRFWAVGRRRGWPADATAALFEEIICNVQVRRAVLRAEPELSLGAGGRVGGARASLLDGWKEEKLASRRDSGALRGYLFTIKVNVTRLPRRPQH
ncbi:hypothetical protein NDU88_007360 [Pleurodeles waltl]|uniref:Uncharacterized protein n=1 Tax=Pleurodeles waltl TaxID=8319 RepID=A0AAV7RPY7_PLEWA|nr:hypothetical protein NDU88_007360 [Pleurodeles waltl]